MKLSSASASILLLPLAVSAISLPNLKSKITAQFRLPRFIKTLADPIAASPVLSLHRDLVSIPSITGNEQKVAAYLVDYLTNRNWTVETQTVDGDRINVYAYPGSNRTATVLLTSHLDTVPPFIPYKSSLGTIYGRGSNDAKGSVAAQIIAAEELLAAGVVGSGDIAVLYVVGEEILGDGMEKANSLGVEWKSVVFGEPTENKLAVGHKGIMLFDVVSVGKASHSGYPQLGVNANSQLIAALAKLDALKLPSSETLGLGTLNIGRIQGGVASNVIPASANASIAVRVAGDLDETVKMIKESVEDVPGVKLVFTDVAYGPVETDHDVDGFETIVCSYGTDIPHLRGSHKKYLYGPGSILTAHGDNEYVLKSDLFDAVNGYKKLVTASLWPTKHVPAIVEPKNASDADETEEEREAVSRSIQLPGSNASEL